MYEIRVSSVACIIDVAEIIIILHTAIQIRNVTWERRLSFNDTKVDIA